MPFGLLADLVLVLHLGFILFAALGALLALRWPRVVFAHLPAVSWGALVEFANWPCPLTGVESSLRRAAGGAGYGSDFVGHYIAALIYPGLLTRELQMALGVGLLVLNAGLYGYVALRRRRS